MQLASLATLIVDGRSPEDLGGLPGPLGDVVLPLILAVLVAIGFYSAWQMLAVLISPEPSRAPGAPVARRISPRRRPHRRTF